MAENEIVLLERFANNGDAEAFSEIVRRHAGLVYGSCLRVLEDKTRAADVVQETFFQLLRQAGQITGSVPSWLHRVATRKAIDVVRRDSRRRRREARYAANKLHQTDKWEHISGYVDEVLDELDDETREILIKHFFQGRTTTDIAAEEGISQPTVSRRVESGVEQLRTKLHNRGILVGVAALGSLLAQSAVEAAPALVLQELGKMALVGIPAAASGVGSATTASASAVGTGAKAVGGGVLAGVKAKVVTAAAVAAVGVGGVVTYKHVTEQAEQPKPPVRVARPVADTTPKKTVGPARTERPSRNRPTVTVVRPQETPIGTDRATPDEQAATSSPDEPATETSGSKAPRAGYGGMYWGRRASSGRTATSEEQEEPNDTEGETRETRSRRRRR